MTSPVAVIGLVWDGHDLCRPDLDLFFDMADGLDNLPEVRGEDQLVPFRAGRLSSSRLPHRRPIVANGHAAGPSGATARADLRAYIDEVKGWMDPTVGERILVATLEDGSLRWITCAARNILPGEGWGGEYRALSLEWEAVSDPLWHSSWGTLSLDAGYVLDDLWSLDASAEVIIVPTSTSHAQDIDTLGTAAVDRIRATFTGPSSAAPGLNVTMADGSIVGYTFGATLTAGQTLVIDSYARTVTLAGTNRRDLLTLLAGNQHGEYIRFHTGTNTVRVTGQPAECRIHFTPAWN